MDEKILVELSERIEHNGLDVGNDLAITEPMVFVPKRLLVKIKAILEAQRRRDVDEQWMDFIDEGMDQVGGTE